MKLFTTSMMCANVFKLQEEIKVIDKYTDFYHIDVMDGHFVPNLALSFDFIKQLRSQTKKPIDAHLMMTNPGNFVDLLIEFGVDYISLHPKTIEKNVFKLINKIKSSDIKVGIVLSPSDGLDAIKYYKDHIDKITVMTVEPGFAGQGVIPEAVSKIKEVYDFREENNLKFLIEVDGSNNFSTFDKYYKNGTDIFVLGSTLFNEADLEQGYLKIKKYIETLNG
ncbi:MAG: ribulose-phosphate 3-epimerase [Tenericutes bacterium]|nr:ribulose-phosphate 3-epimerase [Mycoplasmatota bacterium]